MKQKQCKKFSLLVFVMLMLLTACVPHQIPLETTEPKSIETTVQPVFDCPPAVMINGVVYYVSADGIRMDQHTVSLCGYITGVVSGTELPDRDGRSNFPAAMGEPYGYIENQLYLRFNGKWHLCTVPNES